MNFVGPIRDINKVSNIARVLKEEDEKYYIMFLTGIYGGLRISDILKLKIKDVKGKKGIKNRDKKTGKENTIEFHKTLIKAYDVYCSDKDPDDYLIKSPEGYNNPITRQTAWNQIKKAGEKNKVYNLGTHSLRKTFGYHYYKDTKNIGVLMNVFNHSKESTTLKYIGVIQDDINTARTGHDYFNL